MINRYTRKTVGRSVYKQLKAQGIIDKKGYLTQKGKKIIASIQHKMEALEPPL